MLSAVIFDFDGVIVDSEPLHYRAFMEVLAPHGIACSWDEYREHYMGFDDRDGFRAFFALAGQGLEASLLGELMAAKATAFQTIVADGVVPYPGVLELIDALAKTTPLALCSGALRSDILPVLEKFNFEGVFQVIVTADDVAVSKPDPASYRLAVESLAQILPDLGVSPGTVLAIEDTPAGIASARGAGLAVLGVTNNYPAGQLVRQGCLLVLDSLEGVTPAGLEALFPDP
ncbi:haloacid dehalogenase [Desulfuromonas soudanensis]|uniref:Haloacid dehalogenase n=1 Tax=Desulfuromonas soudanensis TaxID=1603606 RepID=A0A0M4D2M0_9BACT|nr:HAD family phosphatase [Desulfuromonas soudanensis]ALC16576.1 haloacid dehalogenase [Desulfuromonas soudanensis]